MPRAGVVPVTAMHRIVEAATRAPSVHNTQPWRWRASPDVLELFVDRTRRLPATDPDGRNMIISCGAALHHAQVVATALGWAPSVTRHPDPGSPDLLARLELAPSPPTPDGAELLRAVEQRCTDRRRFTSWPVPGERLEHLAAVATTWGTNGRALTDVSDRFQAERLVGQAADLQARQREAVAERDQWLDRSTPDGIPRAAFADTGAGSGGPRHRFEQVPDTDLGDQDVQLADGLVVLFDAEDEPASWVRAGEGLSAMWLTATTGGLSVVPLSQAIEVERTREAMRAVVLRGLGHPLLLARVGWQAIGRSGLARSSRRPVEEVLEQS